MHSSGHTDRLREEQPSIEPVTDENQSTDAQMGLWHEFKRGTFGCWYKYVLRSSRCVQVLKWTAEVSTCSETIASTSSKRLPPIGFCTTAGYRGVVGSKGIRDLRETVDHEDLHHRTGRALLVPILTLTLMAGRFSTLNRYIQDKGPTGRCVFTSVRIIFIR